MRCLKVEFAERRAFAEIQGVFEVVRGSGHIESFDTAGAIHAQGVIDRICPGYIKLCDTIGRHNACIGNIRRVISTVAESVWLIGGDAYTVGRISLRTGHVEVDVVRGKVACAIPGIEQGAPVYYKEGAVASVVSLQGVDKRPHLAVHLPGSRGDIFQVAGLVECPVTPVAALLIVEHGEDAFVGHHGAEVGGASLKVVLEVGENEVPQPRVVSLESVFACLGIPCVAVGGIAIDQEAVVALAELGVTVVICDIPFTAVPCAQHHVLGSLVNTEEVVGEDIVGQEEILVEVLPYLVLEFVALERGDVVGVCPGGDTVAYP